MPQDPNNEPAEKQLARIQAERENIKSKKRLVGGALAAIALDLGACLGRG